MQQRRCHRTCQQVPVLAQAGFRVVAPDLRGFGDSGRPRDVSAYALQHAQRDVLELLDALHIDRCLSWVFACR